ncbi:MAG: NAD-dependent epimerase/dehydratase family protein [Candidatus Sulfotelmatobacter sp.]
MTTLAWVVGRGGLLGSSVGRKIGSAVWRPERPILWGDPLQLRESISYAVRGFQTRLAAESLNGWCVYWCAGNGVVGSPADRLAVETASLRFFLNELSNALNRSQTNLPGRVFLASSAGGVYGGNAEHSLTETTPPRPISDYGRAKIEQEQVLRDWAHDRPTISTLVGRLSNLYGPGQRLDKPQGLISHMSRCVLFGVPVRIYVPLDTIRDYLFAEDAAARIVGCMARLEREATGGAQNITKIFGSENETTVAGIIGVFRQIAKRHVRVVSGLAPVRSQQPARLQFRSVVWPDQPALPRTELLDGVNRVHRHQLALFQAGRLPPPPVATSR